LCSNNLTIKLISWSLQVGDPTIIVNNAGVFKGKLLLDLTEEDINEYVHAYPST